MKLAPEVLVEIMSILQQGLLEGKDISEALRELDLEDELVNESFVLKLSPRYIETHPRGGAQE